MSCENLEPYHDGELPPAERDRFRAHLEGCASCREELGKLEKLTGVLQRSPAGGQPRWDRYVEAVRERTRPRWGIGIAALAAAVLVAIVIGIAIERQRPRPRQETPRVKNESREKEMARIRELIAQLDDPSPKVQIEAAQKLTELKDEMVRELLMERAKKQKPVDPNGDWSLEDETALVARAMQAAERAGDGGRLLRLIGPSPADPEVREAISKWVGALLASSNQKLKWMALEIALGTDVELPWTAIVELVDSPEVGAKAVEVLKSRTGKDFGTDKKAWRRYLEEM